MSCGPTIVTQKVLRPLRVTRADRGTVVVRDPAQSLRVTRESRNVVVTREERELVVERPVARVVRLVAEGPQGPRGAPGGSIAPIDFAWGDADSVVYTATSPGLLALCRVDVTTPFDGIGAAIRVGTASAPEAFMPAAFNDPTAVAGYQRTPDVRMASGDQIVLSISPGSSPSAGAGILILEFLPD